jgi:hypothetical protein
MSLDRDIKEAFAMHSSDVRENPEALAELNAKVTRAHQRRLTAITGTTIALLIAAVVVVPKLIESPQPQGFATTDPTTSPSPSPSALADPSSRATFRNERDGYETIYPRDWKIGRFEAAVEFTPPGLPGLPVGDDTFSVEAMLLLGETPSAGEPGLTFAPGEPRSGRDSYEASANDANGQRHVYRIDWAASACPAADCEATLRVMVFGSTDELWEKYYLLGEDIARSMAPLSDELGAEDGVTTLYGSVTHGGAYREDTAVLVRFLDARSSGGGAEPYMTSEAKKNFENLYGLGDNAWLSYEILSREAGDANSVEFTIRIEAGQGHKSYETIGVGRDGASGGFLVRYGVTKAGS